MSSKTVFLLDTNVLVEAYKRYYSFDIAPSFWAATKLSAEAGLVLSIDRVRDEINKYDEEDQLKKWVRQEFDPCFVSTSSREVLGAYRDIIGWSVSESQFYDSAKAEFASVADSWLIACAKAHGYIIVTHEVYSPMVRRKIPIPNVCQAFDMPYINTFEMLRRLGVRLG